MSIQQPDQNWPFVNPFVRGGGGHATTARYFYGLEEGTIGDPLSSRMVDNLLSILPLDMTTDAAMACDGLRSAARGRAVEVGGNIRVTYA